MDTELPLTHWKAVCKLSPYSSFWELEHFSSSLIISHSFNIHLHLPSTCIPPPSFFFLHSLSHSLWPFFFPLFLGGNLCLFPVYNFQQTILRLEIQTRRGDTKVTNQVELAELLTCNDQLVFWETSWVFIYFFQTVQASLSQQLMVVSSLWFCLSVCQSVSASQNSMFKFNDFYLCHRIVAASLKHFTDGTVVLFSHIHTQYQCRRFMQEAQPEVVVPSTEFRFVLGMNSEIHVCLPVSLPLLVRVRLCDCDWHQMSTFFWFPVFFLSQFLTFNWYHIFIIKLG